MAATMMTRIAKPSTALAATAITLLPLALFVAPSAYAQNLASFGVLAGSTVTNTGSTVINGNVGVSPGTAITGFPPGVVTAPYTIHQNDAVAAQAQSDLTTAYNVLAARPTTVDLTGLDLGGRTLGPGVYNFNTSAQLTGILTLDGGGDPNAVFVFNIGSTLTTASASSVVLIGSAKAGNVFFRVGSSATLGTSTAFQGKILALTSITLNTSATIDCGAALARNGAVTLDTNVIKICPVEAITVGGELGGLVGGGVLPLGFQVLTLLTPAELDVALAQISGELGTAVAFAGMQAMDSFLTLLNNPRGPGVVRSTSNDSPGTVSVMGYAPQSRPASGSAFASFDQTANGMTPDPALWEIWAAVYGSYSLTGGDAAAGTHSRSSHNYGIATGFDYRVTENTKVGLGLGAGGTNFALSDNLGSGHGDLFQAALYSRTDFDPAYVATALAYGYHMVSTDRYVTFAGIDHFTAKFAAHSVAGEIEAGYRMGPFTPYAALRGQAYYTPAYSETTVSGSSTFALDYRARTALAARTEIGAMIDWSTGFDDGTTLGLHARAGWAHYFGSDTSVEAGFQALPGSNFTTLGAARAADSLLLSAGAEIGFDNGLALAGSVNGEFAQNAQTYAGTVKLGYKW